LPPPALAARLFERTGLRPERIDTVFLTNFRPAHRAGLPLFAKAKIVMHEIERQSMHQHISQMLAEAPPGDLDSEQLQADLKLLETLQAPDDKLAEQVDLFPLFGYTPGNAGLLLSLPTTTVLIAGDAVATQDHFLAGQILPDAYDVGSAREALQEVYEIADLIIPGHDNIFVNPRIHGI